MNKNLPTNHYNLSEQKIAVKKIKYIVKRVFSFLKFDSQRYLFIVTITIKHLTLVQ